MENMARAGYLAKSKTLYPSSKGKHKWIQPALMLISLARQQDEQNLFEDGQQSLRWHSFVFPLPRVERSDGCL